MTDYVIWSNEHKAWRAPARRGYSRLLSGAGRYTREEALAICVGATLTPVLKSEIPIPLADALWIWGKLESNDDK